MLISIIMPVFNHVAYLPEAIGSILGQSFEDFELIVVDDASTDETFEWLSACDDPRLVTIRQPQNIGLTKCLNICLDRARGEIIARQDGDDFSHPRRLEEQLKRMGGGVGLVSCYADAIDDRGEPVYERWLAETVRIPEAEIVDRICDANFIVGAASMFSREVFEAVGYYDESLYLAQDYNYWIRILTYFGLGVVPEELYTIRIHDARSRKRHPELGKVDWLSLCNQRARSHPVIKERDAWAPSC